MTEPTTERPRVALVNNSLTPYRLHYHRRIVRELTEIELASVFTHGESNSPWAAEPPAEINPVLFGVGESSADQSRPRYALREWRKGGRIFRWLRDNRVRAVVLGGYNDAGRLRIIRWCRRSGVPLFLFGDSNIRGDTATGPKARLKRALLTRVLRSCTGVMPCGSLGQEYFERYGVPRERMFLCPYEPDYELIAGISASQVADVQSRFGLVTGRRHILYSGRLAPEKRVDLAIDAFAGLANERPEWDLAIAGDGPLAAPLRQRVPADLQSRVHWLGFVDDQSTIAAINRACDVLALPSDYEPWAVVVNEAVAAGLAVVASDTVGAAADLVRDGVNGKMFEHGNLDSLVDGLCDVTARFEAFKAAAPGVLAEWRRIADPVDGLRRALQFAGIIT